MNEAMKFWVIALLIIYVTVVSYIGYRNRASESSEDYFLASRSLPSWLLAITFIASWWGGGSAVDLVDHAMRDGISTFWIYGVPVLLSTFLMYIFSASIRRIGTISQPQLFQKRYNALSALMLSIFIMIFMTIGIAVQVIVLGQFLSVFLGVDYIYGASLGTILVVIYSLYGGFRGVVLTDLLQFGFFLFSAIFLFVLAYNKGGGFEGVSFAAMQNEKIGYTNFMHNIGDNIAYVITFGASWMVQANVWQRITAAKSPSSARHMMAISFILFIPLYLMVTLTGMFSLNIFGEVPSEGVVASMVTQLTHPFVGALIFVGLCSAIMSTMDSMLNTGALSLTIDIYRQYINKSSSQQHLVVVGRISTLIIAIVALFVGVRINSVLTISWIGADYIATGAFVPLIAGFVWRRGTSKGAIASMLFGIIFSTYNLMVALGLNLPIGWEVASATQASIGIGCSAVIYVVVSLLSPADYKTAYSFIKATRENRT